MCPSWTGVECVECVAHSIADPLRFSHVRPRCQRQFRCAAQHGSAPLHGHPDRFRPLWRGDGSERPMGLPTIGLRHVWVLLDGGSGAEFSAWESVVDGFGGSPRPRLTPLATSTRPEGRSAMTVHRATGGSGRPQGQGDLDRRADFVPTGLDRHRWLAASSHWAKSSPGATGERRVLGLRQFEPRLAKRWSPAVTGGVLRLTRAYGATSASPGQGGSVAVSVARRRELLEPARRGTVSLGTMPSLTHQASKPERVADPGARPLPRLRGARGRDARLGRGWATARRNRPPTAAGVDGLEEARFGTMRRPGRAAVVRPSVSHAAGAIDSTWHEAYNRPR